MERGTLKQHVEIPQCQSRRQRAERGIAGRGPGFVAWFLAAQALLFFGSLSPSFTAGIHRASSRVRVRRLFFGDVFGGNSQTEPTEEEGEDDQVYEDEPGRGGPYAPSGFDRKRMKYEIVRYPHPALRATNEDVKTFDRRLRRLADNLFATMYASGDGIGLAAPQVGVNMRVMVYNSDPSTKDDETVFVNPRITDYSRKMELESESCLSFPRIKGNVPRAEWVEVEAVDWEGNPFQRRIEGFEARLFQHEYDHLDGIVFTDRLGGPSMEKVQSDIDLFIEDFKRSSDLEPAL
eukprot:TRINITY_DN33017_c0_g1_i1.p1 TRINITY_DN33017_c0_g1~~TRINITY_DN33017_c0_g1_i1.p1  ORF type:complete len:306 (+),score=43.84 TRINITY_DN33017_c0_g1_i1:44-919(+)